MTTHETPTQLHLMQARVHLTHLNTWMAERGLSDAGHALHCLLTETLGAAAPRTFRLMTRRYSNVATLYGYVFQDAGELRQNHQAFASPAQSMAMPDDVIQTKPMPLKWHPGSEVAFDLRCRPLRRDGNKEIDAYRKLIQRDPSSSQSRLDAYVGWLDDRMKQRGTASLKHASVEQYQQSQTRTSVTNATPYLPETVMRGVVTITDGERFTDTLAQGIGRHRSYGFGMLLIKPAIRGHGIPLGSFRGEGAQNTPRPAPNQPVTV